MGEDRGRELRGSDVRWSAGEIHLPQSLNEEASADEFSEWGKVSSMAAELFAPTQLSPPVLSHTSPGFLCPQGRKKRKKAKKEKKKESKKGGNGRRGN